VTKLQCVFRDCPLYLVQEGTSGPDEEFFDTNEVLCTWGTCTCVDSNTEASLKSQQHVLMPVIRNINMAGRTGWTGLKIPGTSSNGTQTRTQILQVLYSTGTSTSSGFLLGTPAGTGTDVYCTNWSTDVSITQSTHRGLLLTQQIVKRIKL
jgi:hypothetical protein